MNKVSITIFLFDIFLTNIIFIIRFIEIMDQYIDSQQLIQQIQQQKYHQLAEYSDKITKQQLLFDNILKCKAKPLQIFQNFHSPTIYHLWLKSNDLQDISPLIKVSLPQLTGLWLRYNKIESLSTFRFLHFPKLMSLLLDNNNISSIRQLVHFNFPALKQLDLKSNQINDISPLAKAYLPFLQILDLNNNYINDIEPITKMACNKLRVIQLMNGSISNEKMIIKISVKRAIIQIEEDIDECMSDYNC